MQDNSLTRPTEQLRVATCIHADAAAAWLVLCSAYYTQKQAIMLVPCQRFPLQHLGYTGAAVSHFSYFWLQDGESGKQEVIDLQGQLTRAQLELIVANALQTQEQDSEGLLIRIAERLRR